MTRSVRYALVAAGFAALGLALQATALFNHDVAWLLHLAREQARGAELYRDIVEINPPLAIWLLSPIVRLAELLGLPDVTLFRVAVAVLATVSIALTCRLLPERDRPVAMPVLAAVLFVLPAYDYGQREHLLVALLLPTLALAGTRMRAGALDWRLAAGVGALAGLAYALKPHYLLAWLLVLLAEAIRRRSARVLLFPEHIATAVVGMAYLAAVPLFAPAFFDLARLLGPLYLDWHHESLSTLLAKPQIWPALLVLLAWPLARRASPRRETGDVAALFLSACVFAVLVQQKGFPYHYVPAMCGAVLLGVVLLAGGWLPRLSATVALLWVTLVVWPIGVLRAHTVGPYAALAHAVREAAQGGPVLFLTQQLRDAWYVMPAVDSRWASRLPTNWWLQAIYVNRGETGSGGSPYHDPAHMPAVERWLFETTVEDLLAYRPAVIVTLRQPPRMGATGSCLDPFAYLAQDSRAARALARYEAASEVGSWIVWRRSDTTEVATASAVQHLRGCARAHATW